ncbi:hypothetical protein V6N13_028158 [Hibiscus sabdariffa]|uniref:SAP domain-containing protein n=1 Tax=Hibiscus sabdariffa TaxID=183260 RepID=A0ABR2DBL0_9ROSI
MVVPETHVAQSYSSGVDLHEVPIISVDGLPAQRLNTSYGPTPMCFENEKFDDSISNASRLQEFQIEIADKSLGVESEPVYPSVLNNVNMFGASGETRFFGGRSFGLRAGLDKFIWKANPQKPIKMLRSSFKGTRGKNRGSHPSSSTSSSAIKLAPMLGSPISHIEVESLSEAETTLDKCKELGVEFAAPKEQVLKRLQELEEADGA